MITLLNLLCGSVAVLYAVKGGFTQVWVLCILASCFDFCDGFAARKLGSYSEIGKELDSLSDLVSFGLAPSIALLSYYKMYSNGPSILGFFPLAIVACSALRLAKFNLDTRQTKSFLGLPTPACGLLAVSMTAFGLQLLSTVWFIPSVSAVLSALLVCELPMFSLKQKSLKQKYFFLISLSVIVLCLIINTVHGSFIRNVEQWMMWIFITYIVVNLIPEKK